MLQILLMLSMMLITPVDGFHETYRAVCLEESEGDPTAFRASEWACGIAQIRPIYVRDCNRICQLAGDPRRWTLQDCYCPAKSYEMYLIYVVYYSGVYYRATGRIAGPEQFARIHNGGPDGWKKRSTLGYWRRVQQRMKP